MSTSMAFEVYSLVPDANSVGLTQFASGIEPVTIVTDATLPTAKITSAIMWQDKLYRWDGSAYVSSVAAGDVTGQITSTQIADDAITSPKIAANAVTASEIAADAVVAGKIAAAAISTREIATDAVTADKIAANSISAQKILANSITGDKLVANTITGDKIQAGTVTANLLQSGTGGGNLLPNASLAATYFDGTYSQADGYGLHNNYIIPTSDFIYGLNLAGADWAPDGYNCLTVRQPNDYYNGKGAYIDLNTPFAPVVEGAWYEFSIYSGSHRCKMELHAVFVLPNGNWVSAASIGSNDEEASGGRLISGYKRIFGVVQAPAGASRTFMLLRKYATKPGYQDSWAMWVMPQIAMATGPQQTQPSPWSPSGVGTQIHGGVLKTGTVTADRMAVTSLSAITGNMGYLTAGEVHGGSFHSGGFSGAYAWPSSGQRGFHLGPGGLLMGNANDGHWVEIAADGKLFTMPGLRMQDGKLYIDQLEVIGSANIKANAVSTAAYAEATANSKTISVTASLTKTAVYQVSAERTVSPNTNGAYTNSFTLTANGNIIANSNNDSRTTMGRTLILGAGTHTFTVYTSAPYNGGSAYVKNISVIGIIQ